MNREKIPKIDVIYQSDETVTYQGPHNHQYITSDTVVNLTDMR